MRNNNVYVPNSSNRLVVNQIDQISTTRIGCYSIARNLFQQLQHAHGRLHVEPKFLKKEKRLISWIFVSR